MTFSWLFGRGGRVGVREVLVVHDDVDVGHLAELAQLDRGELDVGGTAAPEHVHVGDGGGLEAGEHVVGDLGRAQVDGVLRQHAGDVERDVAVADDGDLARRRAATRVGTSG